MSEPIGVGERETALHSQLPLRGVEAIISTLRILDLPYDEYFLVGGANLVLRGVKEQTRDIDALVSDAAFYQLATRPDSAIKQAPAMARRHGATNTTVWVKNDSFDIPFTATTSMGDGYYPQSFASHKDQVVPVEGFPCVSLEAIRASKIALQRPNDLLDIEAIARHLEEPVPKNLPTPTVVGARILS